MKFLLNINRPTGSRFNEIMNRRSTITVTIKSSSIWRKNTLKRTRCR